MDDKTYDDPGAGEHYHRQEGLYARVLDAAGGEPVKGVLLAL